MTEDLGASQPPELCESIPYNKPLYIALYVSLLLCFLLSLSRISSVCLEKSNTQLLKRLEVTDLVPICNRWRN